MVKALVFGSLELSAALVISTPKICAFESHRGRYEYMSFPLQNITFWLIQIFTEEMERRKIGCNESLLSDIIM